MCLWVDASAYVCMMDGWVCVGVCVCEYEHMSVRVDVGVVWVCTCVFGVLIYECSDETGVQRQVDFKNSSVPSAKEPYLCGALLQ